MSSLKFEPLMITSRRTAFRLMLGFALALGTGAFAADESKGTDKGKDRDKSAEKSPSTRRATKTHTITIKNGKFSPAALAIKPGDTVTWKNDDDRDHTVIADDRSFKSDNISGGDDFKHTFKKAGTFKYGCKYHPREKGSITVET